MDTNTERLQRNSIASPEVMVLREQNVRSYCRNFLSFQPTDIPYSYNLLYSVCDVSSWIWAVHGRRGETGKCTTNSMWFLGTLSPYPPPQHLVSGKREEFGLRRHNMASATSFIENLEKVHCSKQMIRKMLPCVK